VHTIIIGRDGAKRHLPVLLRARRSPRFAHLFAEHPVVLCDGDAAPPARADGLVTARTIEKAAALVDPARTVVHLCSPAGVRPAALEELAGRGFRWIIVEEPLALNVQELAEIAELRRSRGLELVVQARWQASALTCRLGRLVESGSLGSLLSVEIVQDEPRFSTPPETGRSPAVFDVEMPHSVGVALCIAGSATVVEAEWNGPSRAGGALPGAGSARIALEHAVGVRTEIASDLGASVLRRRLVLTFTDGYATGHYPVAEDGGHAQLTIAAGAIRRHLEIPDDALTAFLTRTYRGFAREQPTAAEFAMHTDVVRLLCQAKSMSVPRQQLVEVPRARRPADIGSAVH